MFRQMFVNLAVKDLDRSVKFFSKLGFKFNQQFTDKNATCMIVGEDCFVMLLVEPFFKSFIKKEIANSAKTAEAIIAVSVDGRGEVDEIAEKALAGGAKESKEKSDLGWMYTRSFSDLDGHLWEIFFMDESAMPKNP